MNVVENSRRTAWETWGAGDAATAANAASDAATTTTTRGMLWGVSVVVGVGSVVREKAGNSSNLGVANSAVANQLVFPRKFFSAILKRKEKIR